MTILNSLERLFYHQAISRNEDPDPEIFGLPDPDP